MTKFRRALSLACLLCLTAPGIAAADQSSAHQPLDVAERVIQTTATKRIPPGATYVQKWVLDQLPGKFFATKADAIAAGFNASLMRMDLHQVTILTLPQAEVLAQNR